MKFYTNKISTGKAPNFSEFVQKLAGANSQVIKTASEHVEGEEECLDGKQNDLPVALKEKIIEKNEKDGECKVHEDKESDGEKPKLKKEECYASNYKMVRIANLDAKTKSEWKAYWKTLYPAEYVEAMFADK